MTFAVAAIAAVVLLPLIALLLDLGKGGRAGAPQAFAATRTHGAPNTPVAGKAAPRRAAAKGSVDFLRHDEDLAYRRAAQARQ